MEGRSGAASAGFLRADLRLSGLAVASGAVTAGSSALGFFGSYAWPLDLFSHFRVQYFGYLSILALGLMFVGRRKSALVFGTAALVNLGTILPLYFDFAPPSAQPGRLSRAMLINVNTERGDLGRVGEVVLAYNPDIVVLEEVSLRWLDGLRDLMRQYPYSKTAPRDDNFGIAFYSKLPVLRGEIVFVDDPDVPSVVAEVDTPGGIVTIIGTHPLPPGGAEYSRSRNRHLARLPDLVRKAKSPVVLLGDLNVSPWSPYFSRLLRESGLRDSSQGRGVQPTWPAFNPLLLIPIDHCLHSPEIRIARKEIGPAVGSDHYPLIVDFAVAANRSKSGTRRGGRA